MVPSYFKTPCFKFLFRFLFLAVFLIIGALMFREIENSGIKEDIEDNIKIRIKSRAKTEKLRQGLSRSLNVSINQTTFNDLITGIRNIPQPTDPSMLSLVECGEYSWTIVTTIGYGVIVPKTAGGKVATIFYAICGIPLCLYTLAAAGTIISSHINSFLCAVEVRCLKGETIKNKNTKVLIIQLLLATIQILSASALSSHWKGWSYFDSVYAWFITFSTIGFGDMVPGIPGLGKHELFAMTWSMVVLIVQIFGLCTIASVINTITEILEAKAKKREEHVNMLLSNKITDTELKTDFKDETT